MQTSPHSHSVASMRAELAFPLEGRRSIMFMNFGSSQLDAITHNTSDHEAGRERFAVFPQVFINQPLLPSPASSLEPSEMSSTDESDNDRQRAQRKTRKTRSKSRSSKSSGYESTRPASNRERNHAQQNIDYNSATGFGVAAGLASMRTLYAMPYDPTGFNPMMLTGLHPAQYMAARGPSAEVAFLPGMHRPHANHHVIGPYPAKLRCPHCKENVVTILDHKPGTYSYSMALVFAGLGCFCGCCLIPLRRKDYQDVYHQCPECHTWVGHYKRWYGPPHYSVPTVLKEGPHGSQSDIARKGKAIKADEVSKALTSEDS